MCCNFSLGLFLCNARLGQQTLGKNQPYFLYAISNALSATEIYMQQKCSLRVEGPCTCNLFCLESSNDPCKRLRFIASLAVKVPSVKILRTGISKIQKQSITCIHHHLKVHFWRKVLENKNGWPQVVLAIYAFQRHGYVDAEHYTWSLLEFWCHGWPRDNWDHHEREWRRPGQC